MLPEFDRHGLSPDGLVGHQLDHDLVAGADLILTMSRRQRSWIIDEWPEAGLRTAMLTSTAQLASAEGPVGSGRAEIRAWARSGAQRTAEDVQDPYGRSPEVARRSADVIAGHVDALGDWLASVRA